MNKPSNNHQSDGYQPTNTVDTSNPIREIETHILSLSFPSSPRTVTAMVEKNQWISVKDRLPKEFEIVIIPGGIGYYTKEGWFTITHESYPKLIQWPVLLWQPLPTPIPLREANDKLMIAAATLRERLEKVEKENEQLTQWHRDWVSGKWVKEQTANIDRLRERLEKVEKALKEARDVLVMASLIDKTSTCMDAVNEIDQLLTKEG